MRYTVKTRNWNGNRFVAGLLNAAAWITGTPAYRADDHDNKYYLETDSGVRAWAAWTLFMALRRFSGGWTYIVKDGAEVDGPYKAFYL